MLFWSAELPNSVASGRSERSEKVDTGFEIQSDCERLCFPNWGGLLEAISFSFRRTLVKNGTDVSTLPASTFKLPSQGHCSQRKVQEIPNSKVQRMILPIFFQMLEAK